MFLGHGHACEAHSLSNSDGEGVGAFVHWERRSELLGFLTGVFSVRSLPFVAFEVVHAERVDCFSVESDVEADGAIDPPRKGDVVESDDDGPF